MLAISYITAHFLFASAKYLFTQNCKAPSGVEIFDGFSQSDSCKVILYCDCKFQCLSLQATHSNYTLVQLAVAEIIKNRSEAVRLY